MGWLRGCVGWLMLVTACGPAVDARESIELAFIRSTVGESGNRVMGAVPGEYVVELVAAEPFGSLRSLAWSFDGRYLAFEHGAGRTRDTVVFSMGSGDSTVFPGVRGAQWSPTTLEFIACRGPEGDVGELVVVDFEAERDLGRGCPRSYSWASDGERFVVTGTSEGSSGALEVVDADTGASSPVALRLPPDIDQLSPLELAWSPKDDFVALSAHDPTGTGYSRMFGADIEDHAVEMWAGDIHGYGDPVWSPDGARVAADSWGFDAVQPTDSSIVIFDAASGEVGDRIGASRGFAWSDDGRWATTSWVDGSPSSHDAVVVHDAPNREWISTRSNANASDSSPAWRPGSGPAR